MGSDNTKESVKIYIKNDMSVYSDISLSDYIGEVKTRKGCNYYRPFGSHKKYFIYGTQKLNPTSYGAMSGHFYIII